MSKNKEIFLKKHAPIISLADVWNDPRYSDNRQAYEARLKQREKLIERMKSRTAKEAAQCLIFGLAFWGAILAAAEFGLRGQDFRGNNLESRIASPNAHTCTDTLTSDRYAAPAPQCSNAGLFHAPPKLPQRDGTLQSVFHTVPAPWRENAGLFSRPKSGSRASANSADIHQNVPENGSGTVAQERRTISPREEQTNKNESTGSFYLIIGSARGARNLPVGGF